MFYFAANPNQYTMIVFGWNSFLIKSYILQEFGFFQNDLAYERVEHRQKYFHLMFIPFFPIGRFWAVRIDGKLYHPSAEILSVLQSTRTNNKNALWAWSGVFAVLLGFFFVSMSEKMTQARYRKESEDRSKYMAAMLQTNTDINPVLSKIEKIDQLTDSLLSLPIAKQKPIDTSESAMLSLFLKIIQTQKDSIQGISDTNNLVIASFDDPLTGSPYISQGDFEMLKTRQYNGEYMDTSTFGKMLRRIKGYRYLTLVREYNRVDGQIIDNHAYAPGYLLSDVYIMDIENGKLISKFKSLGSNEDTVSTVVYGETTGAREQFDRELNYDLIRNSIKSITEYIYGKETESRGPLDYYAKRNNRPQGY